MGLAEGYAEMPEGSRNDALSGKQVTCVIVDDPEVWDRWKVEERMIEAMEYLNRVSRKGYNPFAKDGPWGLIIADTDAGMQTADLPADYVKETVGELFDRLAKERGGLRAAQVTRMEQALDWIGHVPAKGQLRHLVGCVLEQKVHCTRVDWRRVRRDLRRGDAPDMLRMSYARAMDKVACTLNRGRIPVTV